MKEEGEGEAAVRPSVRPSLLFLLLLLLLLSGSSFPVLPTQSRHHYTTRSRLLSEEGMRLALSLSLVFLSLDLSKKCWGPIQNSSLGLMTCLNTVLK